MKIEIIDKFDMVTGEASVLVFLHTDKICKIKIAGEPIKQAYHFAFKLPDSLTLVEPCKGIMEDVLYQLEIGINEMFEMYKKEFESD